MRHESNPPALGQRRERLCVLRNWRKSPPVRWSLLLCAMASILSGCAFAQSEPPDSGLVLRVNTREVILDLLALDSHDRPILDLARGDLAVSEVVGRKKKIARDITSLRLVDPAAEEQSQNTAFMVRPISCKVRMTPHYVLAYRPSEENWSSGFHKVAIEARRKGLKLTYQHNYYVGEKEPLPQLKNFTDKQIDKELGQDACGSPSVPPSISVRAQLLSTGPSHSLRYSLTVDPESLAFVPLAGGGQRLQLDYGACNFNARGERINFFKSTTDQVISMVDYKEARVRGLRAVFAFEAPRHLAMTRFVVRDRATGNIGLVNVILPANTDGIQSELEEDRPFDEAKPHFTVQPLNSPGFSSAPILAGRRGSFGSVIPQANALCGDVYAGSADPEGTIFANFLQVPEQLSPNGCMIPGLTCNAAFRVDYRGVFWVRTQGEYEFELTSDDGSQLEIDDKMVVSNLGEHAAITFGGGIVLDAGRHYIHIPYDENGEGALMLELWVRPPGGDWKVFDTRDFAPPASQAGSNLR